MVLPIKISIVEEYDLAVSRGYQPLQDYKKFVVAHPLRVYIQRLIFGNSFISKGRVIEANQRFYKWCWENNPHYCEECVKPLENYSSVYISHILTRGANSEKAHDPRNKNILCFNHHTQWEDSIKRKNMRIYKGNLKIIELLKKDYK